MATELLCMSGSRPTWLTEHKQRILTVALSTDTLQHYGIRGIVHMSGSGRTWLTEHKQRILTMPLFSRFVVSFYVQSRFIFEFFSFEQHCVEESFLVL